MPSRKNPRPFSRPNRARPNMETVHIAPATLVILEGANLMYYRKVRAARARGALIREEDMQARQLHLVELRGASPFFKNLFDRLEVINVPGRREPYTLLLNGIEAQGAQAVIALDEMGAKHMFVRDSESAPWLHVRAISAAGGEPVSIERGSLHKMDAQLKAVGEKFREKEAELRFTKAPDLKALSLLHRLI